VSRRALTGLVVLLASASQVAWAPPELPLGPKALDERRSSVQVTPTVRWTRISREGGPWRVNVLSIEPEGRVAVTTGGDAVGVRARPSALARRLAGVAAINGGYFAADGNPAGALASAGILLSEPVGGRTALALGDHERRLTALRFAGAVTLDGETRLLDGVNAGSAWCPPAEAAAATARRSAPMPRPPARTRASSSCSRHSGARGRPPPTSTRSCAPA
jgi:hypothetical protein